MKAKGNFFHEGVVVRNWPSLLVLPEANDLFYPLRISCFSRDGYRLAGELHN